MFKALPTICFFFSSMILSNLADAQYVFERFDINPGGANADPNSVNVIDTFLYFTANDGTHGREMWRSDGSQSGTQMIKDIIPGKSSTTVVTVGTVNGKTIFIASDNNNGYEPWVTDGTANGTQMLKDVYVGPPSSLNTNSPISATIGNLMYFTVDDGPHGKELWLTDGTTNGTNLLKDINPGTGHSVPSQFKEYMGKVYFTANDGTHGTELWVTDGTPSGTNMVLDASSGAPHSYIAHLTVYNNKLYYTGFLNLKHGLIESDGTAAGTKLIAEVSVGSTVRKESSIVLFNGKMYFGGADTSSPANIELWMSDGTTNGTSMVKDINTFFGQSSNPHQLTVVGNQLFFAADDGTHKEELWVTDGTANGTVLVKDILPNPLKTDPLTLMAYGNKLFFGARDSNGRTELWVSDGTTNGTTMIKGYDATERFVFQGNFTVCNNALYFAGYDYPGGYELWKLTDTTLNNNPPTTIANTERAGKVIIAPNPAHDRVNITLDNVIGATYLSIVSIEGKTILKKAVDATQKNIEVALPNLPTGTYLVNIHHTDGVITERLLID